MKLLSSNQNKIREFKEILGNKVKIEEGRDLKEVNGTAREVIIYKSLEAGKNYIVEDTIVTINGKEIVNIRWNIEGLREYIGAKIQCIVHLGYNDGENIIVYKGVINGTVSIGLGESGFGFDPFFIPDGENRTLAQLSEIGLKHDFSARKIALENLLTSNIEEKIKIGSIPKWEGDYQKD